MGDAVVVSTARTPIATSFKGSLRDVGADQLATTVVAEAVRRSGLPADLLDDVVLGESRWGGGDLARYAAVAAGLDGVPGLAHNRHCASSLAAVATAASSIRAGMDRAVVAGGVESKSTAPASDAGCRAPTTSGTTGRHRATWPRPTRPPTTCRSPSGGTPPCRRG